MTGRAGRWIGALLHLAPSAWRNRYRDEIAAQLSSSDRRLRDSADIVLTALRLRIDQIQGSRHLGEAAVAILVVGAVWTAWAVPQLADGVIELPGHWWSAPGPALLLGGGFGGVLASRRRASDGRRG
jgi:hypothetical protein